MKVLFIIIELHFVEYKYHAIFGVLVNKSHLKVLLTTFILACVASVSVGFGSKERSRNGIFGVFPARKMGRERKRKRGVGGCGRRTKERLQTNPLILKNLRSPANGARDWLG